MKASERQADLFDEAERIVRTAENDGVVLRLIGGLAIRFHRHGQHSAHFREYHDKDLFGLGRQRNRILSVFNKLGYSTNQQFNNLYPDTRLQFVNKEHQKSVDVLLDKFRQHVAKDAVTVTGTEELTVKLDTIRNSLVSRKKGLGWRIRSLVGERVR